ncbi:sigma-70 family RNA polymerase sigma factor [Parapedobacter deserti]|uniref:Sigma-70 family RNA polymerase sigma factor n=1 Tax=Parapedobacter deserti TaxID=1912957 RepID=A0ABV7JMW7_9SPHI
MDSFARMAFDRSTDDEDKRLWHLIQTASCHASFDRLYEKYWAYVFELAYARTKDLNLAEDITQGLFLRLWEKRQSLQITNIRSYLFIAVKNGVLNWIKAEQRKTPLTATLAELQEADTATDHSLLYQELLSIHDELIDRFTPAQQEIYHMRFRDDLTTKEIADKLGISRKTVQNQVHLCVTKLKKALSLLYTIF